MDIKALKAQRRVLRTAFTVTLKKLQSEIQGDAIDLKNISLLQTHLKDKYLRLETVQESVSGVLLQKDDDGTEYEADFSEAEKYREDYLSFSTLVDKKLEESGRSAGPNLRSGSTYNGDEERCVRKSQNRPCKTLRRIGGKDESTGEPWKNAGEIWRFPGPPSRKLSAGRDPVDMGERTRNHQEHSENVTEKNSRTLTNLITFLRQEVQGEEMVVLARSGFTIQHGTRKKEFNPVPQKENSVDSATAASLVSLKSSGKKPMCIFCDKSHASHKCFCAKRLLTPA
ncbi:DUF1758 domain-containing protein [Trichonephila inaurata madagascariensis]|uniref:DUF1758 domain-containing protein n=1 Tax=Trichonephila inaurata madagascariensis TaxID=2747483 RepID=A0A8X6IFT0_9ARAC|nr:DUF1758 domain-containing protein [Trichonephila inaurata madagascariensis]